MAYSHLSWMMAVLIGFLSSFVAKSFVVHSRTITTRIQDRDFASSIATRLSRRTAPFIVQLASSPFEDDDEDQMPTSLSSGRLPENYQELGNELIYQAGKAIGAPKEALTIEWKNDKIVVTVDSEAAFLSSLSSDSDEDWDEEEGDGDNYSVDDDDADFELFDDDEILSEEDFDDAFDGGGIDVTELARTINRVLEDDGINGSGVGLTIAQKHSIEVTTPGSSDEIRGDVMFEAYKGFDVICVFKDIRKKDKQEIEKEITGRLVERVGDKTTFNLKGRMKSIKNDKIVYVKLPTAKREKGAR